MRSGLRNGKQEEGDCNNKSGWKTGMIDCSLDSIARPGERWKMTVVGLEGLTPPWGRARTTPMVAPPRGPPARAGTAR